MNWETFGLDLNDTKTYIERSKFDVETPEDLVFPPSDEDFGILKLVLPCLRIDCINDIERFLIKSMKYEDNKEIKFYSPSTFKIKDIETGIERRLDNNEILERLTTFKKELIKGDNSKFPHEEITEPMNLVLQVLPIPPKIVRPTTVFYTTIFETKDQFDEEPIKMIEDDLTHKLFDIYRINQRLIENFKAGAPQLIIEDLWELLQYHVTTYIDNRTEGIPPARHITGRKLNTIVQKFVRTNKIKNLKSRFSKNLDKKFKSNFEDEWS